MVDYKNIIILFLLLLSCISVNAQKSYVLKSKDGKVSAEKFLSLDDGIDSLVIINQKNKFKFSHKEPFITIKDDEGYNLFDNGIVIRNIHKIKNKIYFMVGYGGSSSQGKEFNLFFLKKMIFLF